MCSRLDFKLEKQESQFRIQEISKKKANVSNKNQRYSVISYQKRVQLINLAASKGYSISRAARELGIKPSTGKFIVKCYRDNGKIMKKTQNQQSKSALNSEQWSKGSTGDNKSSQEQKYFEKKNNFEVEAQDSKAQIQNFPSYGKEEPIFLFGYSYEQPVMNQMVFYPNYENLSGMVMPIFFTQPSQY